MEYLILCLIGLVSGMLGAMFGLGGSAILIPALNEVFGLHQHMHQSAAMILNLVVVSAATWNHARRGAVNLSLVRATIPAAIAGVIIGVQVSELGCFEEDGGRYLAVVFGVFLLCMALFNWRQLRHDHVTPRTAVLVPQATSTWRAALLVGLPTGFVAGLLGVGGGLIAVPAQQILLRIPLLSAIANSAATACGLSVVGAIWKNYHWWSDHPSEWFSPLILAAVLLPASLVGSLTGSRLAHDLPVHWVRRIFILLLLGVGLRQVSYVFGGGP